MTLTRSVRQTSTPHRHTNQVHGWFSRMHQLRRHGQRSLRRWGAVGLMLLISLLLSGCVRYDVGIHFDSPHRGQITQHIQVEERLKRFSGGTAQQWLTLIEQRTQRLGGRLERLPDDDRFVTIPFTSSGDLQAKFNEFFSPFDADQTTAIALPPITSQLTMTNSNWLLAERNRLRYELDLRSLGVLSTNGSLVLSPASLIDLEFRLSTPWGAHSVKSPAADPPLGTANSTLVWKLIPGELNRLDVVFWLPSPIGIGTVVIVVLVLVGRFVKYPPRPSAQPTATIAPTDTDPATP